MSQSFDFEEALKELRAGKDLTGKNGILMPLIKQLTEAAITGELEHHIATSDEPNRKNGNGSKIIKTGSGCFELNAPRDRAGSFESQLLKKNQTQLTPEIDRKLLSLFSHGMSYRDMKYHIHDLYGIDELGGFPDAIASLFPKTEIQLCIIHQIRNSMKYVASKNQKAFMADLKPVYRASSKEAAETALDELEEKWGDTCPIVIKSWRQKWEHLSAYFKYPEPIRKIIYTTNAVEAIHRQFRKLTKTKGAFPNENSLLKLLYAGILNATEKWTMPIQNWSQALSQLDIYFEGRLDGVLEI